MLGSTMRCSAMGRTAMRGCGIVTVAAVVPRFFARLAFDRHNLDTVVSDGRAPHRFPEAVRHAGRNFKQRFARGNPDRADVAPADVAAAAQQRQDPARIGILVATGIEAEPHGVLEPGTRTARRLRAFITQQILRRRQPRAVRVHKRGGNFLGRFRFEQLRCQRVILLAQFNRGQQGLEQAATVGRVHIGGRGRRDPFRLDPRAAQDHLDPPAPRIGYHQHGRALAAGAAGPPRTMLQGFGIARQFNVNHQAEARQIDPARGDVGGHADPRPPVTQRLQRMVAFALAVLARQRHRVEPALEQAGMQAPDIVARGAEQDRGFRFVQPQQVDHGVFDVGRGHGHRLVADIAVAAFGRDRRYAQSICLVAPGQRGNRGRHRRREQHRAAFGRGAVENFLEVFAEAHVEHLVGLVEHDRAQSGQVERAAFEVVTQPARCAHDDVRAVVQGPPLAARVHAADTRGDARAGRGEEPFQLAADLQRQFARRRDYQRQRPAGSGQAFAVAQHHIGEGQPEGDGLARSRLGRHDQIAAGGLGFQHGGLHGGRDGIAARGQRVAKQRREFRKRHGRQEFH